MKVITSSKDYCPENITLNWWWYKRRTILPDTPFLWTNANAREILSGVQDLGDIKVEDYQYTNWQYPSDPGKSIVVMAPGGIGDVIVHAAVLRKIKRLYPETVVTACTASHGMETIRLLLNNIELVEYPVRKGIIDNYDSVLIYEDIAKSDDFIRYNLSDFMLHLAGLPIDIPDDEKIVEPPINPAARIAVESYTPEKTNKWVAIQVRATSHVRSYPTAGFAFFVGPALAKAGYTVFFTGSPYDFGGYFRRVCNECGKTVSPNGNNVECERCGVMPIGKTKKVKVDSREYGIIDLCGVMETIPEIIEFYRKCDLIITPDSAALHFGGILGVPTIALFGMMPHELRTKYYKSVVAIQGEAPCAPCYHFGTLMPCENKHCIGMTNILPERIIDTALDILK